MNVSGWARLAASCGAFAPLQIAIEYHDGTVAATGTLDQPFALIGRDGACDIALSSEAIEPQAAFMQVIGGQLFVGDLGTRHGLRWRHGRHPYGWLFPDEPLQIGPFTLRLLQPVSPHPAPFGPTFHPLVAGPDVPAGLPPAEITFKTGQADRNRWLVNRVLTLVGSSPDCKIVLDDAKVARFHCFLLHTLDGLWAIDLTGQSRIAHNGQPTRVARLGESDELIIGRFVISCSYPSLGDDDGVICFDEVPRPIERLTPQENSTQSARRPMTMPDEQISLTIQPPLNTFVDLDLPPTEDDPYSADWDSEEPTDLILRPTSHEPPAEANLDLPEGLDPDQIRSSDSAEMISVQLEGLESIEDLDPPLTVTPPPPKTITPTTQFPASPRIVLAEPAAEVLLPRLQQLAELQARLARQFQESLQDLVPAIPRFSPSQQRAIQEELDRLAETTRELLGVQADWLDPKKWNPGMRESTDSLTARYTQLHQEQDACWNRIAQLLRGDSAATTSKPMYDNGCLNDGPAACN